MRKSQRPRQDQHATMETNSYSIVSKRSVEKLYLSHEPAFLEPFVPQDRRRAPLINRGYWLRMRAIETTVEHFIKQVSSRRRVVVNLGCGYDPLPFRMLSRHTSDQVLFVDVDYPALMKRKTQVIKSTDAFQKALGPDTQYYDSNEDAIYIRSPCYVAAGADLADIDSLNQLFRHLDLLEQNMLFVAEVSITYMTLEKADQLIRWAAGFSRASFCVLEQFLPDGPDHPFARTMLDHFSRQQAPIQSVMKYHSLDQHRGRFLDSGWNNVRAQSLWDYWEDTTSLQVGEKLDLDAIEPFDEWEEFVLFASHYFLLVASNGIDDTDQTKLPRLDNEEGVVMTGIQDASVIAHLVREVDVMQRFAKAAVLSDGSIVVLGVISNLAGTEVFAHHKPSSIPSLPAKLTVGHSLTEASDGKLLLVGGRTSPARAKSDCFLYEQSSKRWRKVEDILPARYRHTAVPVMIDSMSGVLVHGGVTSDGTVLGDWQVWIEEHGWISIFTEHSQASADPKLFGAAMLALDKASGILLGGLDGSKSVSRTTTFWEVRTTSIRSSNGGQRPFALNLSLRHRLALGTHEPRARFGAELVHSRFGPLLIGGVARTPISHDQEILLIDPAGRDRTIALSYAERRPLLVGMSTASLSNGDVLVSGGGAVCFSFGQFMNKGWFHITFQDTAVSNVELERFVVKPDSNIASVDSSHWQIRELLSHEAARITEGASGPRPCVIRDVDPGDCVRSWTLDELRSSIGPDTRVSIHEGLSRDLEFYPCKNFTYKTCPFSELVEKITAGAHVYLRSLAADSPFQKPANLARDFPSIASDFVIPDALEQQFQLSERLHSSVLRLSGNVAIWLHYDVMSNFLFQIRGAKTVILYSPTEALALRFAPGSTTSPVPIAEIEAAAAQAEISGQKCRRVTLQPGDVLFIPRFWLHATVPGQLANAQEQESPSNESVAVNVFWRDLDAKLYAAGRDVYGSRDLGVYENGRTAVARIAQRLREQWVAAAKVQVAESQETMDREDAGAVEARMLADWLSKGTGKLDLANKMHGEVERLRRKFAHLPKDVGAFYLPRLAGELIQLYEAFKP